MLPRYRLFQLWYIAFSVFSCTLVSARRGNHLPRRPQPYQTPDAQHFAATVEAGLRRETQIRNALLNTLFTIEHYFHLPAGSLGPAYPYLQRQAPHVAAHLNDLDSRMLPLLVSSIDGHILFVSPAAARHEDSEALLHGLLLFHLYPGHGAVVPIGFAQIPSVSHGGPVVDFYDMVVRRARSNLSSLVTAHGPLRIVDPRQLLIQAHV